MGRTAPDCQNEISFLESEDRRTRMEPMDLLVDARRYLDADPGASSD